MLPLRGKYIFPNTVIHFDVSRSRSVKAIEEAMEHDQMIFLNNQIDPTAEDPGIEDLYRVGTLAKDQTGCKASKEYFKRVLQKDYFVQSFLKLLSTNHSIK